MKVRFKTGALDSEFRICYEVESATPQIEFDEVLERYCLCYNLKLLGFVCAELLEVDEDENSLPAVDVFIQLQKQ